MNVEEIAIYSHDGRMRSIRFNAGRLNVLTGESKTGKSALLDIVEFCLGRSTFLVPAGPITQRVSWYGVLLSHGEARIWIGRPAPSGATSSQAMLEIGSRLEPPEASDLAVNADVGGVRAQLDSMLGIEEFEVEGGFGSYGNAYQASISHAATFCFQQQGEIASQDYLFHRQADTNWAMAIRNTLPYFLGAVPPDFAAKRSLLVNLKREQSRESERLRTLESDFGRVESDLEALYEEAVAFGLLVADELPRTEMIAALREAVTPSQSTEATPTVDNRRGVREERRTLLRRLEELTEQKSTLQQLDRTEREFHEIVERQVERLQAAHILPPTDADVATCPLCTQSLPEPDATVQAMLDRQHALRDRLTTLDELTLTRVAVNEDVAVEESSLMQRLTVLDHTERELIAAQRSEEQSRTSNEAREYRRGRVSVALEKFDARDTAAIEDLSVRLQARGLEIEALEEHLGSDAIAELLAAKSNILSEHLETYARVLELEHSQWPLRLDLKKLTVVADTPTGSIDLSRIGSGENWVGYHVVAHMALHRLFAEGGRPVPRFMMLDQPSQAHFPPEMAPGAAPSDHDRIAVTNMFKQLHDFAAATGVQVIVSDHAELTDDWFRASIVETWRDGVKLVPEDWPEA